MRIGMSLTLVLSATLWLSGCAQMSPSAPTSLPGAAMSSTGSLASERTVSSGVQSPGRNERACWGEATQVFAQMGEMGEHASQQATPRLGLRNVARALYEQGILADDSLQALGAFLSAALGLSIASCL